VSPSAAFCLRDVVTGYCGNTASVTRLLKKSTTIAVALGSVPATTISAYVPCVRQYGVKISGTGRKGRRAVRTMRTARH